MYATTRQSLRPREKILLRLLFHAVTAVGIGIGAHMLGVLGCHFFAGFTWVNSLLTASMILAGMRPGNPIELADYSLTKKGILLAQQTAGHFANHPIRAVYITPLKNAHETAAVITRARFLPVIAREGLREMDVGELEMQPPIKESWDFHHSLMVDWLHGNVSRSFPGGEIQLQLSPRMQRALTRSVPEGDDRQEVTLFL